ncbi:MAG: hypothetical protein IPH89_14460 [Bacteroidetes bacterium]|nr:hypothetical protein [Bacteroidota bacterium]
MEILSGSGDDSIVCHKPYIKIFMVITVDCGDSLITIRWLLMNKKNKIGIPKAKQEIIEK